MGRGRKSWRSWKSCGGDGDGSSMEVEVLEVIVEGNGGKGVGGRGGGGGGGGETVAVVGPPAGNTGRRVVPIAVPRSSKLATSPGSYLRLSRRKKGGWKEEERKEMYSLLA